ncbi:MAG: acetamidase/formamidase family protein [Pararobbsia sp.]
MLEVRILDVRPRPSCHACHLGRCFGSNVAASWGFQYHDLIEEPKPREVVTIFELDTTGEPFARAVYNYVWTPQTDPDGIVHSMIDYPGVRVDHTLVRKRENILHNVKVPARLHFGTMGLAPSELDYVSSIPPSYTGGNIDDWRVGKGARMYYPVAVEGAFFSVGDPHAAQGDSELGGTAIETSLTGDFEFVLHKKNDLGGTILEGLTHPLLETDEVGRLRFHVPELPRRTRPRGANRGRQARESRQGHARRVPQVAALPDDGPSPERRRGDRAAVGRRRFRRDTGRRCELGRARFDPQERLRRQVAASAPGQQKASWNAPRLTTVEIREPSVDKHANARYGFLIFLPVEGIRRAAPNVYAMPPLSILGSRLMRRLV